jgi:low affinity Fe/Cu permease
MERDDFRRFSQYCSSSLGSPTAFVVAIVVVAVWAMTGPFFHFSDTWQLIINTGTTIVTFLMVFVIQNAQNRDGVAIQLKLNELLRAVQEARTGLVDLESWKEEDIQRLHSEFERLSKKKLAQ